VGKVYSAVNILTSKELLTRLSRNLIFGGSSPFHIVYLFV
jgi:hypothetical protein